MRWTCGGQSSGGGTSWHRLHCPLGVDRPVAERGVDGEDLAVADVAHGAGLGDLVAVDGDRDVDVEHLARLGVRQVLAGRPHQRPPARALEGRDRRAEPAATEQERRRRAEIRRSTGSDHRYGLCVCSSPRNVARVHEARMLRVVIRCTP